MTGRAAVLAVAALLAAAGTAGAQDAYVVGASAAMTGPQASTYASVMESLRVYIKELNGRGGVNGRQVRFLLEDDQGEPSKAAANAAKLIDQEKVVLFLNASASSTYAPTIAMAKRANVPVLFAGGVCPKEVFPPTPEPMQFCTTGFGVNYDSMMALTFIKEMQPGAKVGFAAMAIPVSRGEMEYANGEASKYGLTSVGVEVIPPPTPDYTPFATKLRDAGADWVVSWAPWVTQVKTFEALRRLGWKGRFIGVQVNNAEDEMMRMKDDGFHAFGTDALFVDKVPAQDQIRAAFEREKPNAPVTQAVLGWLSGQALEAGLKGAGWPTTPDKVAAAMSNVQVDTQGLRGSAIVWTKNNHYRTQQSYRVWRWDSAKNTVVMVKDWTTFEVK
jgi:ABC-type branched-subunit amino acid transport system substrate-binding protein